MSDHAEIGRIVAALRELSEEMVERVRQGSTDGTAAYACGAADALADRLERVLPPAVTRPTDATNGAGVGTEVGDE